MIKYLKLSYDDDQAARVRIELNERSTASFLEVLVTGFIPTSTNVEQDNPSTIMYFNIELLTRFDFPVLNNRFKYTGNVT